jgi:glycine oxidase
MGLACALEAASRGRRVAVIDPHSLGRKASWAAAGILAGRAGVVGASPFRDLYLRSLEAYPAWLESISAASGMPVPYHRSGDYQIFPLDDPDSLQALRNREKQLEREKASAFSVQDELPGFLQIRGGSGKARVFHFPNEAHVPVRTLLAALEQGVMRMGVAAFPGLRPLAIAPGRETEISGKDWRLYTRQTLIAAGAWCNDALGLLGWSAPLSPVKGQLALLPDFHGQPSMVHGVESFYLVPRDGLLVAGATTEPGVWEEGFDAVGERYLRSRLQLFFPSVRPQWTETWSGLRPRSRDRLPLMGWVDEAAGIALCTGHYKSGISLAPLSAALMSALLQGENPPVDPEPFRPLRRGGLRKI